MKCILVLFSIICLCSSYKGFSSCEVLFLTLDGLTVNQIQELSPRQIKKLSPRGVKRLTREQIQALNLEQIEVFPIQHLLISQAPFFLPSQVNRIISSNRQMLNNRPMAFSVLIRVHISHISPFNIPFIPPGQIRLWSRGDIEQLTPEQTQVFTPAQHRALERKQSLIK